VIESTVDILLVEDNPDDAELALRAFATHRLANTIHVARDGEEALDYLFRRNSQVSRSGGNPKVVLLDLKLPKVDGLEVLRTIRSDERLKTLPVVVLTSSSEEKDVVESYRLGVNSYIVKPVSFEQFTETARVLGFYWLLLNVPPPIGT
jgi:two-component system, response regulator